MTDWQQTFIDQHDLPHDYRLTAEIWFVPVLDRVLQARPAGRPLMVGIQGCQGSGKSTLAAWMQAALHARGLRVAVMSLDDFYLSRKARRALAERIHPLLQTRGVPGTHDTHLLADVLGRLRSGDCPVTLPRFDKATDNPRPEHDWPVLKEPADVVILEGWCWGIPPEPEAGLTDPVNALEVQEDPDGRWRQWVNARLASDYAPLYALMDKLWVLRAPGFGCVARWRTEQESRLRETLLARGESVSGVMTPEQIERFVAHYERLTRHGLKVLPDMADVVWQLDDARRIVRLQTRDSV
ncbi:MAG: kinase [Gammaproteobacteria bacterium]|nr:MAG: kinase [Gammaproteobacteria bacterium]